MNFVRKQLEKIVQGSLPEKMFYVSLYIAAIGMFVLTLVELFAAFGSTAVTATTPVHRTEVTLPAAFFCYKPDAVGQTTKKLNVRMVDNWGPKGTGTSEGTEGLKCPETSNENLLVWETDGATHSKGTCVMAGFEEGTNAPEADSAFATIMSTYIRNLFDPSYTCVVLNEKGVLKMTEVGGVWNATIMQWKWSTEPQAGAELTSIAGFLDPEIVPRVVAATDPSKMLRDLGVTYNYIPIYNSNCWIGMSMDTLSDFRGYTTFFPVTDPAPGTPDTKKKFNARVNCAIKEFVPSDNTGAVSSALLISVDSMLGNDVVLRRMSLTELWAEVGGAWASAALILGVFFLVKNIKNEDGEEAEVQVMRFGSLAAEESKASQKVNGNGEVVVVVVPAAGAEVVDLPSEAS